MKRLIRSLVRRLRASGVLKLKAVFFSVSWLFIVMAKKNWRSFQASYLLKNWRFAFLSPFGDALIWQFSSNVKPDLHQPTYELADDINQKT